MAKLINANVAYNTPETARIGHQVIVEAKLSSVLPPEDLASLIDEPGIKVHKPLKASERMVATLSGGTAFDITPAGAQQQVVAGEVTEWEWQVTPKVSGEQTIILRIDAILTLDGKDNTRTVNTLKAKIKVDVGWPQSVSEWVELVKNAFSNGQWLWGALLVPAGVLFRRLWPKPTEKVVTETDAGKDVGAKST